MKRQLKEDLADDFFFVHESIIYGVLRACHITLTNPDYEDFLQIGRIKLVEAYEYFPKNLSSEMHFYQFTGYAYQRIRWAILDEVRKDSKRYSNEYELSEEYLSFIPNEADINEDNILLSDLFQSMLYCLSKREQDYLIDAVIYRLNMSEIARKYGVSRKTVYKLKYRVSEKLKQFKTDLRK